MFLEFTQPMNLYALTEGPSQPEFNSFTPISTSDMVDLTSGDFNYNIPIMDVGGYPINLAYNSNVTMDQEASWVGLGWNLNVGQINRNVRGLPDDFNGDEIITKNNIKPNITVGVNPYVNFQLVGIESGTVPDTTGMGGSLGAGINIQYNNYRGISCVPSFGLSFNLSNNVSVGAQLTSSNESGASITPNVSLHQTYEDKKDNTLFYKPTISPSITYNSRQGLQSFNLSTSTSYTKYTDHCKDNVERSGSVPGTSGSISFVNNTFTPSSRQAYKNNQFTFSFSVGPNVWGFHGELSVAASASIQTLLNKTTKQKSYGYEFSDYANNNGLLDFNREKEMTTVTKNTMVLPITNYTYDILTIQSQGGGGNFRPFRGQVGRVYDPYIQDVSMSGNVSLELEAGTAAHIGGNIKFTNSNTRSGIWNTVATPYFKERTSNNHIDYEKTYFKMVGESRVDKERAFFVNGLGGNAPITLTLDRVNNDAINKFSKKSLTVGNYDSNLTEMSPFMTSLKRQNREKRNQAIQKFSKDEVTQYLMEKVISPNTYAKSHHTAGYIVTDENGNRQVFGETVYNLEKDEVSFAIGEQGDCSTGLVSYGGTDDSEGNTHGIDRFYNKVSTPAYAHTYLLSSILSSDYEDLLQDGPTDDDLGSYTKFTYTGPGDISYNDNYKWRVPFQQGKASFNIGLRTDKKDQKASYLYGVKEVKYVKRIETKTHVAIFDLEPRKDGFGVQGKDGGIGSSSISYKIKSIRLFTKKEAENGLLLDSDPDNDLDVKPIKTAHFIYDYSLCNLGANENNNNDSESLTLNETANQFGKLTLKKVYFTYRNSNMGKYTPYVFNYSLSNPSYNVKNYDIWGNYMENTSCSDPNNSTSPQEFPYVNQTDKIQQDAYASSWSLTSIDLPSGGKISVTYETDDYQYVQDKKAMRMFKVDGVTSNPSSYNPGSTNKNKLYGVNGSDYVAINIGIDSDSNDEIKRKYTDGLKGKPIYFNFYLNMVGNNYDYVTGYFELDSSKDVMVSNVQSGSPRYLFIPMKKINREGKGGGGSDENPISVAGWFFGRQNLNYQIYGQPAPTGNIGTNIVNLGRSLINNLEAMKELMIGANGRLKDDFGCAKTFVANKSWIRLNEPDSIKYGGGSRVKTIEMFDQWDDMIGSGNVLSDVQRYKRKYGQEYSYRLNDDNPVTENIDESTSSGVATYEPNICKENPLVMPFYNKAEKLSIATYQEKPFGESFFPSPTVTYSRVTVKNITAADDDDGGTSGDVRKTKSGVVVTEHYTTKDFPTITDYTDLSKSKDFDTNEDEIVGNMLRQYFIKTIDVYTNLTMTQGFYIETNDMNGKVKKQSVYNNGNELISSVEYKYSTDVNDASKLQNNLTVINEKGEISVEELATHYDVINDFREYNSSSTTIGINPNVDIIPIGVYPLILGFGVAESAKHRQVLKTAVTTKVVHKTGILKEKIAYDLGSSVSIQNLAWDANTGQVLLTKTVNEYNDNYYSMNYPAYWKYDGMGMATDNLGIEGTLKHSTIVGNPQFELDNIGSTYNYEISDIFHLGDELNLMSKDEDMTKIKAWVAGYTQTNGLILIDKEGKYIDKCGRDEKDYLFKITRSAYRNQQMQSMAAITSMVNPLLDENGHPARNLYSFLGSDKVINASAIEYKDFWPPQSEHSAPLYSDAEVNTLATSNGNGISYPSELSFNPYLNNYKADWRASKSYAYLVGRVHNNSSPRHQGFFKTFAPFYGYVDNAWNINSTGWTYASEISQFSSKGAEIENRDALDRYSSAQYDFKNNLPLAVVSNSKYQNMGYEGFEEDSGIGIYDQDNLMHNKHFIFFAQDGSHQGVTTNTSHTGQKSIRVGRGTRAYSLNPLFKNEITRSNVDCSVPMTCPNVTFGVVPDSECFEGEPTNITLILDNPYNGNDPNNTGNPQFTLHMNGDPVIINGSFTIVAVANAFRFCLSSVNSNSTDLEFCFPAQYKENGVVVQNFNVTVVFNPAGGVTTTYSTTNCQ